MNIYCFFIGPWSVLSVLRIIHFLYSCLSGGRNRFISYQTKVFNKHLCLPFQIFHQFNNPKSVNLLVRLSFRFCLMMVKLNVSSTKVCSDPFSFDEVRCYSFWSEKVGQVSNFIFITMQYQSKAEWNSYFDSLMAVRKSVAWSPICMLDIKISTNN